MSIYIPEPGNETMLILTEQPIQQRALNTHLSFHLQQHSFKEHVRSGAID
jgi:hypothetical protein